MYKLNTFLNYLLFAVHIYFTILAFTFLTLLTFDIFDIESLFVKSIIAIIWFYIAIRTLSSLNRSNFNYSYLVDLGILFRSTSLNLLIENTYSIGLYHENIKHRRIKITTFYTDASKKTGSYFDDKNYHKRTNFSFPNMWLRDNRKVYEFEFKLKDNEVIYIQTSCIDQFTKSVYPVRIFVGDTMIEASNPTYELKTKIHRWNYDLFIVLLKQLNKTLAIGREDRLHDHNWNYKKIDILK